MPYKYNPFTKQMDYQNFTTAKAREIGLQGRTAEDMEIWLSTTGNDDTGDGTAAKPYASWDKALDSIPEGIDHFVIVKIKPGTYTTTRYHDRRNCSPNGKFVIEGQDPIQVAGPFTLTDSTMVGVNTTDDCSGWDLTVAGAGWTVDAFYRKFIRFTSGALSGCCFPVFSNTASVIKLTGTFYELPAPGDSFVVIEPSVNIAFPESGHVFTWDSHNGRTYNSFVVANIRFQILAEGGFDDPATAYLGTSFIYDGTGNALFGVVEFYQSNAWAIWEQSAGIVNAPWSSQGFERMTDPGLVVWFLDDEWGGWYYPYPSIQFVGTTLPPTASDTTEIISISGATNFGYACGVSYFACRQGVTFETARGQISSAAIGGLYADHHSDSQALNCRLTPFNGTYAIRVDDNSYMDLGAIWIEKSLGNAIICTDLSRMDLYGVGGVKANIVGYALFVGKNCQLIVEGGTNLEGTLGKIRFDQSNSTESWPTAKTAKTDGMGSFVVA